MRSRVLDACITLSIGAMALGGRLALGAHVGQAPIAAAAVPAAQRTRPWPRGPEAHHQVTVQVLRLLTLKTVLRST